MADATADRYFRCTDRERAAFEAGIKLGALFHQFTGSPVSARNAAELEGAMAGCLRLQPYVTEAEVRIRAGTRADKRHPFDYRSLTGEMLAVRLTVRYGRAEARAGIRHVPELDYPLMYLEMEDPAGGGEEAASAE